MARGQGVPFLADLLLVGAAADALPGLVAQEAPPSVVDAMELLRTQILAAIAALVGDDDDGIPPAFRDAFRDE